jgi:hypothetical protein
LASFQRRIIGYKAAKRRSIFVLQKQERNREREFKDAFENRMTETSSTRTRFFKIFIWQAIVKVDRFYG